MTHLSRHEAQAVFSRGSRSFYFASRFLAEEQRDLAAWVYAFCRMVDDVADDESRPASDREASLDAIRRQVRLAEPAGPEVAGLLRVDAQCGLNLHAAVELVEGCASDLHPARMADDAALLRYCYRVASTVGLLMCGVLGVRDRDALAFAIDLGVAMQLTNICRDVLEDAQNGRVYLPAHRLEAVGVQPEQLVAGTASREAVAEVTLQILEQAERYYHSAWLGMRFLPWRARLAILVAARVYRQIGRQLQRAGGDALAGRTVVSTGRKLFEAALATLNFFSPSVLGIGRSRPHDAALHIHLRGLPGTHSERDHHGVLDQDGVGNDRHSKEYADRMGAPIRAR